MCLVPSTSLQFRAHDAFAASCVGATTVPTPLGHRPKPPAAAGTRVLFQMITIEDAYPTQPRPQLMASSSSYTLATQQNTAESKRHW